MPDVRSSYKQGADVGTQYEPSIFYHSEAQRRAALESRARVQEGLLEGEVVTRVRPAAADFFVAGAEHQR